VRARPVHYPRCSPPPRVRSRARRRCAAPLTAPALWGTQQRTGRPHRRRKAQKPTRLNDYNKITQPERAVLNCPWVCGFEVPTEAPSAVTSSESLRASTPPGIRRFPRALHHANFRQHLEMPPQIRLPRNGTPARSHQAHRLGRTRSARRRSRDGGGIRRHAASCRTDRRSRVLRRRRAGRWSSVGTVLACVKGTPSLSRSGAAENLILARHRWRCKFPCAGRLGNR
jgi:hypothetical protein